MAARACGRCGQPFAGELHVGDLKQVERALDIRYGLRGGGHYQDLCPPCRRRSVALAQDALWRKARRRP